MIVSQLKGGLGNQMFQYAFGRALSIKFNTPLYLDLSFLEDKKFWDQYIYRSYGLNIFDISCKLNGNTKRELFFPTSKFNTIKKFIDFITQLLGYRILEEDKIALESLTQLITKNTYLVGYWQSELFFKDYAAIVLNDFTFHRKSEKNHLISNKIQSVESVGVHIRRGDYVSNLSTLNLHGICSMDYYKKAMDYILRLIPNAVFYFFSDDPQWVFNNFDSTVNNHIISWNTDSDSYEDMRLMSLCKHNIIANSSFSWWGAWLNQNSQKIVLAPANWFANPEMNDKAHNITPPTWIRI
jgi:hypothetical protein